MAQPVELKCVLCGASYAPGEVEYTCPVCGLGKDAFSAS